MKLKRLIATINKAVDEQVLSSIDLLKEVLEYIEWDCTNEDGSKEYELNDSVKIIYKKDKDGSTFILHELNK